MSDNIILIKQCQKGSNKAFDKLFNIYSGLIYGICLRYCKNEDEAKDVLQECLIKIIENIKEFKFKGSFEGWIRRIAVNTAINYLRNRRKIVIEDEIEEKHNSLNIDLSANEDVINKLNADDIIDLIKKLPAGCQTIFNLFAIEGYKHNEIAKILNITDSTSRTQYKKARNLLIKEIKRLR